MIHELNLHPLPFSRIKSGLKKIEMRLHDENKSLIQEQDFIEFTNRDSGEKLLAKVIEVRIYRDFIELYSAYDKSELGYLENEVADPNDMLVYYTVEKIQKYGVMAIHIRLEK